MLKNLSITRYLAVAAFLAVGACATATSGTYVSPAAMEAFEKGVATYDDVVAVHGLPQVDTRNSDGSRQIVYTYFDSKVGMVGVGTYENHTVTFMFGPDGTLENTSVGSSETKLNSIL